MENPHGSQQGSKRGRGKNNSATSRRVWQNIEEDVLMATMVELINQQWRQENGGFKPGFYGQLELKLKDRFPGTDLVANPHIESKVKLWKRQYYAVLRMLQTSGFGWNDTDKTINVESDEVWINYVKKDSSVRTYRNKSFPYYDNWCLLFGKDRTTGEFTEGPEETLNAMNEEDIQTVDGSFVPPSPGEFSAANAQPPMQMGCSSGSGRKRSRSERRRNEVATLSEQFGGFFEQTVGSMNAIAQRIGYEQDLSEARKGVDSKLLQIPLDRTSRLKAGSLICKDAHKVDHFSSLETLEERLEWVYLLLSGDV